MLKTTKIPGMWIFSIIWFGQLISLVGSGLTSFALGVWVYQQTGSVTQFALISVFATVPGVLLAPIVGALVDRWDRRTVMMLSDLGSGICTLILAWLLRENALLSWHIYLLTGFSATCNTFQWPAYAAASSLLVPKEQLGRASGMRQMSQAVAQILSPAIAGALMLTIHLDGIILIDVFTFLFAVSTLLFVRIPQPEKSAESRSVQGSLLREAGYGWRYLIARRGLLAIVLVFTVSNVILGVVSALATPMVLSIASSATLGSILTISGIGMLAGSATMSVWGGPKRRIYGMYVFMLIEGLAIFLAGVRPSVPLFTFAAFTFFFALPVDMGCSQAILQSKVQPDVQGRVFAAMRMIAMSSLPFAYLIGGPLADYVFEPLLAAGGPLAATIGSLIGVGPGRGIGLLFIILGSLYILAAVVSMLYVPMRRVELDLPDMLPEQRTKPSDDIARTDTSLPAPKQAA